MRKLSIVLITVFVFVFVFAGCGKKEVSGPEAPVTAEQVHTDGQYAARAYVESLLNGDKTLFLECYPDGFIDELNASAGVDVYEEYRKAVKYSGEFLGTSFVDYKDFIQQNGFDDQYMRSRINSVMAIPYEEIGIIRVEKISAYFVYDGEQVNTNFFVVVFEYQGSWYVIESISGKGEF
ncbi:MAG: hypothetical protein IJL19_10660 [Clostridiales bacterium]|nr:hypothetical protein [Clostridiales bacterium]